MDNIDQRLIILLRRNSREAVSNLAQHLGVTRATVRARIDRLMSDGVIKAFTIDLDSNHEESPISGLMMIKIEGTRKDRAKAALLRITEVTKLFSTNGRWDLIAQISAVDLTAFDNVLEQIREIQGISDTETSLLLAEQS